MEGMCVKFDVIGLDSPCVDLAVNVRCFPKPNGAERIQNLSWQGGGKVASGMVAAARLGLCCVAKVFGVDVEAELGHVGNGDSIDAIDNTNYYTKVEDAVRFVEQTGCDSLAIAVGNAHGPYVKTPNLDLERIYAIRKKVNIPLVLHGCSDIPEEQMKEAVNLGMSKFNIATEYFRTMYQSIEKRINNQEFEGNGVKLMYDIKEEMIDFVIQKIRLLNPNKYSM